MRAAFIGLGQMGRRMVGRLDPHETGVWNRSPEIVRELEGKGFQPLGELETGVGNAEVVVTMLRDHEAVRQVGEAGLFAGLRAGTLWIDMSTGSPSAGESFHALAASQRARFVAAPVVGTLGPAASGQLMVLVGGADEDVESARPILERFGRVHKVGTVRQALAMKLMVNTLLAAYMDAVSECLPIADREGIGRSTVLDVLANSSVAAAVLKGKGRRWEERDYGDAEFPIGLLAKDLKLMLDLAGEHAIDLPGAGSLRDVFEVASHVDGKGHWDMAGVGEVLIPPL